MRGTDRDSSTDDCDDDDDGGDHCTTGRLINP